jgi:hypothetical protein
MTVRQRPKQKLRAAREEMAQLDKRLEAKGDHGLGKGDPLIVRWDFNLARREEVEAKIERLEDALQSIVN